MLEQTAAASVVETKVPARLDRLTWGRFHTLVVIALGITWILDGLEVTIAGSISGALKASPLLHFSDAQVGFLSSAYLAGAVVGALGFGWLTDRLGRRLLFFVTLGLYVAATAATAFSWNFASFCLFRFLTGAGIGGEYSAVNSAVQELIPARARGWVSLAINGSFWIGAAIGAAGSIILINPQHIDPEVGWRAAFFTGAVLGLLILFLRAFLPESPRWLVIHGREKEAEAITSEIEKGLVAKGAKLQAESELKPIRIHPRDHTSLKEVFSTLFVANRQRAAVGLTLMVGQAFFYNSIFFTYALVLMRFYKVESYNVGWYILALAVSNIFGPILLGPLFDRVGRKPMITLTYGVSAVGLAISGYLFEQALIGATQMTIAWMVIFFFASSAASSAYLTVSETFPVEIRALAIAVFYAVGTALGGVVAPAFTSAMIETGSRENLFIGYLLAAALMAAGAIAQAIWGVAAEGKSLEAISKPLSAAEA